MNRPDKRSFGQRPVPAEELLEVLEKSDGNESRFFEWVEACCQLLGWSAERGTELLPGTDPSWYYCFDDGLTPEQAVTEYRRTLS